MTTELQPVALGFDGVVSEESEYDVQFTPASGADTPIIKTAKSEEIGLLEEGRAEPIGSPSDAEKVKLHAASNRVWQWYLSS